MGLYNYIHIPTPWIHISIINTLGKQTGFVRNFQMSQTQQYDLNTLIGQCHRSRGVKVHRAPSFGR